MNGRYLRLAGWTAFYSLIAAGIFWLPYHVEPSREVYSDSREFHFNNQVAVIALLAGLCLATILKIAGGRARRADPSLENDRQAPRWPLALFLALNATSLALLSWFTVDRYAIGESKYFLNRLIHLQIGLTPYRDFDFAYGPSMLYVPWIVHLVSGVSIHAAYLWSVWLFSACGLGALWWLLQQSVAEERAKTAAFCLLAVVPALVLDLGIQYTLLRFVAGFTALALAKKTMERFRDQWYFAAGIDVILTLAVFVISPEIGVAFAVALLGLLGLEIFTGSRPARWILAAYLLSVACVMLLPREMFQGMLAFAAGGNAFPILPSPYILLYVGTFLTVVPAISAEVAAEVAAKAGAKTSGSELPVLPFGTTLTGAFAIHAVAMMPGAMGRADSGHVLYYGTGVFLLAMLRCGFRSSWRSAYFAIIGVVILAILGSGFALTWPTVRDVASLRAAEWMEAHPQSALTSFAWDTGESFWTKAAMNLETRKKQDLESNFPALARFAPICVVTGDTAAVRVLARHSALQGSYYHGVTSVMNPERLAQLLVDTDRCRYVIIAVNSNENPPPGLATLLMFPWLPQKRIQAYADRDGTIERNLFSEYLEVGPLNSKYVLLAKRQRR